MDPNLTKSTFICTTSRVHAQDWGYWEAPRASGSVWLCRLFPMQLWGGDFMYFLQWRAALIRVHADGLPVVLTAGGCASDTPAVSLFSILVYCSGSLWAYALAALSIQRRRLSLLLQCSGGGTHKTNVGQPQHALKNKVYYKNMVKIY